MPKHGPKYVPDAFQSSLKGPLSWLGSSTSIFAVVALTIFLVLSGLVLIIKARNLQSDRAWEAFSIAERSASDRRAERFIEVADSFSGSPAEPFALHMAGTAFLQRGLGASPGVPERAKDLERARDALGRLLRDYPKHWTALYARQALGQVHEESGRYEDAAREFMAAADIDPESYMTPKLRYDVGRCLVLAGKNSEARRYLEEAAYSRATPGLGYGEEYVWRQNARYLLAVLSGAGEATPPPVRPEAGPADAPKPPEAQPAGGSPGDAKPPAGEGGGGGGDAGGAAP
jgi:tetratricopeptide (TPR) repeat protein